LSFVLLAPFAGNVLSGGELETNYEAMNHQTSRSGFLRELVRIGSDRDQLESYMQAVARLTTPHYKVAGGFERMTQFLLGTERIENATLLPVYVAEQEEIDRG
jgi:aspartyl/asparaginyl-tRNA synthetase